LAFPKLKAEGEAEGEGAPKEPKPDGA